MVGAPAPSSLLGTWPAARRFMAHRAALFGLVMLVAVLLVAIIAPNLTPYDPFETVGGRHEAPSDRHVLGTDTVGRDLMTRLVFAARTSLIVGFAAVLIRAAIGVTLGLVAGYYGGWADRIVTRIVDVFMAFPFILLAILIVSVTGPSLQNVIIALGVTGWTDICRIIRAQTLSLRELPYVEGARSVGGSDLRLMVRHILPNSYGVLAVVMTVNVAGAILGEASLSFLGLGIAPPTPSWGGILATGRAAIFTQPWLVLAPAAAILITTMSFNLVGDGIREVVDPR